MVQALPCLARINSCYPQFSKTEKKIADYIIQSPENMVHKTIDQVAEELDVAISTVFRFSKRIGFKGFQAMKIALASEISEPLKEMVQEKITEHDNEQIITEKIFNNNIRMFRETIQFMDFSSIKKAVKAIIAANRVEFYGSGSAALVAIDAHHKFIGSGVSTASYTDTHLQLKAAAQLTEGDVVILISHYGDDEGLLRVLAIAKDNGAKVIGITNSSNSPLSKKSDIALHTVSTDMGNSSEDTYSRIVQLSLIDSLYVNVMSALKAKSPIEKIKNYFGK